MVGFVPDRCVNAVAAAQNNSCGGSQARAVASLSAGYFYVVIAGQDASSLGKYSQDDRALQDKYKKEDAEAEKKAKEDKAKEKEGAKDEKAKDEKGKEAPKK